MKMVGYYNHWFSKEKYYTLQNINISNNYTIYNKLIYNSIIEDAVKYEDINMIENISKYNNDIEIKLKISEILFLIRRNMKRI